MNQQLLNIEGAQFGLERVYDVLTMTLEGIHDEANYPCDDIAQKAQVFFNRLPLFLSSIELAMSEISRQAEVLNDANTALRGISARQNGGNSHEQ